MRLKSALVALSFSLICLVPQVSFADTLSFTNVGGQSADGYYIDPYVFTTTGAGGTSTLVNMSCLNFSREVSVGQFWNATAINVSTINPNSTIDGESGAAYIADAYLYNQYAGAINDPTLTAEIQFAIWSIMDPTVVKVVNGVPTYDAFDSVSQALAADALQLSPDQPSIAFANDVLFIPSDAYPNGGEPQNFMTDPIPSSVTPEPSSLILLGTGLIGGVAVIRRKLRKA